MKTHQIAAAALASILSASPAWPAHALDEHDSYRPFGAGPLTCGNFARALDGLDPRDKDSPKVTFTNYKRFVNGWLTAADRFIPGLNDATGGRDADWFTGVLVSHCRANPSLTIADALEQIINIRFPRLFAEKAPPVTYRSTAKNSMLDKPPADETIRAATDRAAGKSIPPDTDTMAPKTDAEHEEACKKDYRRCTDNTDFMNNSDALIPAQQAAEAKSKYGDPKWPWLAFSNYSEGNEVKTGRLLIGENNAQFQNGFGAWEHVRVVCEFDLKVKQVISVDIIPKG